jgi:mono/diheme cytochrome c family protein
MKPGKNPFLYLFILLLVGIFVLSACTGSSPDNSQSNNDLGKQVFNQKCATCHSLEADTTIVGPALTHIAATAADRMPDMSAREYIEAMLVDPTVNDLEGYPNVMPVNMKGQITAEEYSALLDFLMAQE